MGVGKGRGGTLPCRAGGFGPLRADRASWRWWTAVRLSADWDQAIEPDHPLYPGLFDTFTVFRRPYGNSPSAAVPIDLPVATAEDAAMDMSAEDDMIRADLVIAAAAGRPPNLHRRLAAAIVKGD